MSTFAILVTAPVHTQGHYSAFQFAGTLLSMGHNIHHIFFYQAAVGVADKYRFYDKEGWQAQEAWRTLAIRHQFACSVCVTSALKAGLLSEEEANLQGLTESNIAEGFSVAGLGRWLESTILCDNVVTFK